MKKRNQAGYLLLVSVLFVLQSPCIAKAGELETRMAKVVKTFTKAASEAGLSDAALAVFRFQADKKLTERRVDYACTEILTSKFVEPRTFKVMERAKLETILQEQKLGASGVVESATAAKLGKLLGVKLAVMGSVSRLGSVYHLSTELVDTDTGEILASDVTEIPARIFDEESVKYGVRVPEEQSIGIYILGAFAPLDAKTFPAETHLGQTLTPTDKSSNFSMAGIGVRYNPWSKWMFDLMFSLQAGSDPKRQYTIAGAVPRASRWVQTDFPCLQFTVNRKLNISKSLRAYAGAGGTLIRLATDKESEEILSVGGVGISSRGQGTMISPTVRLGVEWRPQERVGLAIFGNYNLLEKKLKEVAKIENGTTQEEMTLNEITIPQFIPTITMGFYF